MHLRLPLRHATAALALCLAVTLPVHAQFVLERVLQLPRPSPSYLKATATDITPFSDATYFVINGRELWVTDGTESGSRLVQAFQSVSIRAHTDTHLFLHAAEPGGIAALWSLSRLSGVLKPISEVVMESAPVRVDRLVYYVARTQEQGRELWRSDGTAVGTGMVVEINAGPSDGGVDEFIVMGDGLFFSALHLNSPNDNTDDERHLYFTEGTSTVRLTNAPNVPYPASSLFPYNSGLVYNGRLFFTFGDQAHGRELWTSDGTPLGTKLYRDLHPGPASSDPSEFVLSGDQLLFLAYSGSGAQYSQLWAYGGNGTEVTPLASVHTTSIEVAGSAAYFYNPGLVGARGLWVSNGTPEGTHLVTDAVTDAEHFHALNDTVLFVGKTSSHGRELWMTDGSGSSTRLVADLNPGTKSADIKAMHSDRLLHGPQDHGPGGVVFVAKTADGISLVHATPHGATRVAPLDATRRFDTIDGSPLLVPSQGSLYFQGRYYDADPALYRLAPPPTLPSATSPVQLPVLEEASIHPNPARASAQVAFTLAIPALVRASLVDALGREVLHVGEAPYAAGAHSVSLDVSPLPAGVYHYVLTTGALRLTRALVVVR